MPYDLRNSSVFSARLKASSDGSDVTLAEACSRLLQRQRGRHGRRWSCATTVEHAATVTMQIPEMQIGRREDRNLQLAPAADSHGRASSWRSSGPERANMPQAEQRLGTARDAATPRCQPRRQRTTRNADSHGDRLRESTPVMELGPRARKTPRYLTDYIC